MTDKALFGVDLPRVKLAHLPTPIEELSRLSEALGGARVLIKRDDCTGFASGGTPALFACQEAFRE